MLQFFKGLFAWLTPSLVNYSVTVANNRLTQVATALNASGGGDLVIMQGTNELVRVALATVIGAPVNKVLTVITAPTQGTATAAGTANAAKLVDGSNTTVADGLTVGTSGSDVNLSDTSIQVGSLVTINSGTITTP
jgi:hypothetical protein